MSEDRLRAAVAAGVMGSPEAHAALLQLVVDVARTILGAKASSIMLFDEGEDELVFEAATGEGSENLVGKRIPSSTGVAGWVLQAREPLVLDDVSADPRFASDVAEQTGYVPKGLIVVPLLWQERVLGVLSVLDRPERANFSVAEMDLLALFADQAAVALDLVLRARRVEAVLNQQEGDEVVLAKLAAALDALEGKRRESAAALLTALEQVVGGE